MDGVAISFSIDSQVLLVAVGQSTIGLTSIMRALRNTTGELHKYTIFAVVRYVFVLLLSLPRRPPRPSLN
jgi:hypothetical protein